MAAVPPFCAPLHRLSSIKCWPFWCCLFYSFLSLCIFVSLEFLFQSHPPSANGPSDPPSLLTFLEWRNIEFFFLSYKSLIVNGMLNWLCVSAYAILLMVLPCRHRQEHLIGTSSHRSTISLRNGKKYSKSIPTFEYEIAADWKDSSLCSSTPRDESQYLVIQIYV